MTSVAFTLPLTLKTKSMEAGTFPVKLAIVGKDEEVDMVGAMEGSDEKVGLRDVDGWVEDVDVG